MCSSSQRKLLSERVLDRPPHIPNMYLHARYYDPTLGIFLSPDRLHPKMPGVGMNRYAYAGGNPINATDRSGLKRVCTHEEWRLRPADEQWEVVCVGWGDDGLDEEDEGDRDRKGGGGRQCEPGDPDCRDVSCDPATDPDCGPVPCDPTTEDCGAPGEDPPANPPPEVPQEPSEVPNTSPPLDYWDLPCQGLMDRAADNYYTLWIPVSMPIGTAVARLSQARFLMVGSTAAAGAMGVAGDILGAASVGMAIGAGAEALGHVVSCSW